jgi:hypothetical protein
MTPLLQRVSGGGVGVLDAKNKTALPAITSDDSVHVAMSDWAYVLLHLSHFVFLLMCMPVQAIVDGSVHSNSKRSWFSGAFTWKCSDFFDFLRLVRLRSPMALATNRCADLLEFCWFS